jgi:hypothetical protein
MWNFINFFETFNLFYRYDSAENGILSNDVYCINLHNNDTYSSMHVHTSIKRYVINKDFSML